MNNVIKTSSKGARQGGIGLKNILNEGIFTNVIYYSEFADGRKYVGQTTQGFLKRHNDHMRKDKENNHYNNVLQKHMGEAVIYPICFGVEDIEDIDTVDLLNGLEVAEIMLRETYNDVDPENGLNHTTGGYSHEKSQALKERFSKISTNTGIYNLFKKDSKDVSQGFRWIYKYKENGKSHEITSISLMKVKEKVLSNNLPWTILDEKKANKIFIGEIRKMIDEGLTNKEIEKQIGCSTGYLNILLRKRGLPSIKQLRNKNKTHWVKNNEYKYNVDKTSAGYRIRERNHSTIIHGISTEERANELCNMLNNNDLTLKELRKMKLKGQI